MQTINLWNPEEARFEPIEDTEDMYYRDNGYYIYICRKRGLMRQKTKKQKITTVDPEKKIDKQIDEKSNA